MLIVFDIGNSNIKTGLFDGDTLVASWRMETNVRTTSDEYGVAVRSFLEHVEVKKEQIHASIISSVVPDLDFTFERMLHTYLNSHPLYVNYKNAGLKIKYSPKETLGQDRIANATAAYFEYGGPCITVDFGTATSFGAVTEDATFLGGAIAPGIKSASDALLNKASMLYSVEFEVPQKAIANNTVEGLQSGVLIGFSGLADRIIERMQQELDKKATVIATGGLSDVIAKESKEIDIVDKTLTLKGLHRIYHMNEK